MHSKLLPHRRYISRILAGVIIFSAMYTSNAAPDMQIAVITSENVADYALGESVWLRNKLNETMAPMRKADADIQAVESRLSEFRSSKHAQGLEKSEFETQQEYEKRVEENRQNNIANELKKLNSLKALRQQDLKSSEQLRVDLQERLEFSKNAIRNVHAVMYPVLASLGGYNAETEEFDLKQCTPMFFGKEQVIAVTAPKNLPARISCPRNVAPRVRKASEDKGLILWIYQERPSFISMRENISVPTTFGDRATVALPSLAATAIAQYFEADVSIPCPEVPDTKTISAIFLSVGTTHNIAPRLFLISDNDGEIHKFN